MYADLHRIGKKICGKCKQERSLTEFNGDKNSPDKKSWQCKKCRADYRRSERVRARTSVYNKKYAKENLDLIRQKERRNNLKYKFGLTVQQYDKMFQDQGGECKICSIAQSQLKKKLCVDHNHDTGRIRGLLCDSCNRAMGLLKESIPVIEKIIDYLKKDAELEDKKPLG